MKIQYHGTSASEGWPALFCSCKACELARKKGGKDIRTRHQICVDETLLIDFPPDTYLHVLMTGLDLRKIRTLLISHSHPDHFYPDDIFNRVPQFTNEEAMKTMLSIYGNAAVMEKLDRCALDYASAGEVLCRKQIHAFESLQTEDGYRITALKADHKPEEESLLYWIEKDGISFLHAHDTGLFPAETLDRIKGHYFQAISLDCTGLTRNWSRGHMSFEAADQVIRKLKQYGCADEKTKIVLSHLAHCPEMTHEIIEKKAADLGCIAAYDGLCLEIG